MRSDPAEARRLLEKKDYVAFWKRLPAKMFNNDFVGLAKALCTPKKLMS